MRLFTAAFALLVTLWLCSGRVHAQSTTGTIRGHVNDSQGLALPGVTVSLTSPNLQGTRMAVTADNGDYVVTLLPSGTYTVTFELGGFQPVSQGVSLAPTQDLPLNVALGPATVSEEVQVVGRRADVLTQTAQVATNFSQALIASLQLELRPELRQGAEPLRLHHSPHIPHQRRHPLLSTDTPELPEDLFLRQPRVSTPVGEPLGRTVSSVRYAVSVLAQGLATEFAALARGADPDLGAAALLMARVAYPTLDSGRYLEHLDSLGRDAQARMATAPEPDHAIPPHVDPQVFTRVLALNQFLFVDQGFAGNDQHYDDPRNSFLNDVLDRRTGIPITLALVYIEVAKRAGLDLEGVNFPGHFLVRHRGAKGTRYSRDLIIDAHHGGALLSESMCRDLLSRNLGGESPWDAHLLAHATKLQMLTRMLLNLKRAYVRLYSFEQARDVTELLLAVDPTAATELRDRGLLAYHLNDFASALRDLQSYLEMSKGADLDESERDEHARIWEHVKTLRKRVASFN